jgi:hypothetical protein
MKTFEKQREELTELEQKTKVKLAQLSLVKNWLGLVCRQVTNCSWIPDGQILYWIQAEYDKKLKCFKENINP